MSLLNKASLIQIPSGYKDGTLYSAKPTNGDGDFTFSRGSNLAATRVNSEGLIEKGRENLLLQSNTFDTTWVASNGASLTSGQTGYDGSSDAWLLTKSTNNFSNINQSISASGVNTYSVYAKGTSTNFCLRDNVSGTRLEVDLSDGSITLQQAGIIVANVEDVGGGWYKVSATFNEVLSVVQIYPKFNSADVLSVTIQDAQLEQGLVATDYIETTTTTAQAGILEDMPRLDYSGGATCPSLLLEPSRTNAIIDSEYSGNYSTQGLVSLTDNFATSPEGYENAFKVLPTTSNVQHLFFRSGMGAAADTYTQSIFAKANGYNFCYIRFDLPTKYAFFDLQNGTTAYSDSDITSTITDMGNGWYRCTATMTTTNYANAVIGVAEAGDALSDRNFAGDGSSSVLFYGHQSELGSYATSYIPTYGSSVTRSADASSSLDVTTDINGQATSWTIFYEFEEDYGVYQNSIRVINDQSDNMNVYTHNGGFRFYYRRLSKYITSSSGTKILARYNGSILSEFHDGAEVTYTGSQAGGSSYPFDIYLNPSHIAGVKKILLFPTALTDAECEQLTTI